jgi:hypothetical protein
MRGAVRKTAGQAARAVLALAAAQASVYAEAGAARETLDAASSVRVVKLTTPPKVDGVLSEGEWGAAASCELRYQTEPGDNAPASERTDVFLAYDREHLYVAFRAFDREPAALRARVARRDDVFLDDHVSVFLDTFDDRRRAYVFHFNPLGVQADGVYTESETQNLTWDGIVESKGAITADGYVIEAAIPFKTLRFQGGKDRRWGLHVRRWIARRSERVSWRPISRDRSGYLIQMGSLAGLEEIYGGRTLDLIPTLTVSANGEREPGAAGAGAARLNNVNRVEPGLTAVYALTPNLSVAAAVNPDFSQVEADAPQISVNQRFPLFFPEKRPFFLEGAEVFRSLHNAAPRIVDTRQIVDPDWGVKLTGKIGKNTVGFLSAADRAPGLRVAPSTPEYGEKARFNIFRYQRDVLSQAALGLFVTDRRFAGSANTLVAVDGRARFLEKHTVAFQFAQTWTGEGGGGATPRASRKGGATYFVYNFAGRTWDWGFSDSHVARDYRPGAGFQSRTGYDRYYSYVGRTHRPKGESWYVSVRPFVVGLLLRDARGRADDSFLDPGLDIKFARGVSLYAYHSNRRDFFAGRGHATSAYVFSYTVDSFKRVSFGGRLEFGTGVNFDPARAEVGRALDNTLRVTLKPNDRINSEFLLLKSSLTARAGGERFFNQEIYRNRTTYQFTRFSALRSILEYDTAERRFGASLLYGYTPRPNTALFVGYSDLLFNGLDPLEGRRAPGLFRQRRTLFAKLSYNFRL